MKFLELKKQEELEAERERLLKEKEEEINAIHLHYKERLIVIDAKLELLKELLLSDEGMHESSPSTDRIQSDSTNGTHKAKSNGHPFSVAGSMPIREAVIKTLKEANEPMAMEKMMPKLQELGIVSNRKSVRSRLAKMVGKDIERVEEGIYRLIEKN